MFRVTIPFTNEVLFDTDLYRADATGGLVINQVDGMNGVIDLSVKTLLADEIAVFIISLKCPENVLIHIESRGYGRLMIFVLSGSLTIKQTDTNRDLKLLANTCHSFPLADSQRAEVTICGEVTLFTVYLKAEGIQKLVPLDEFDVIEKPSVQTLTLHQNSLIAAITSRVQSSTLHRILLVAKVLELLFLDLEYIKKSAVTLKAPALRPADRMKLEAARALIGQNLQSPCSLIELAHKVGLNDFKLKKGFKAAFGTTVFGYLADLRMEKAKKMLADAHSVSEVAHEVGYKNAHHFAVAFKKRFNLLPSQMRG